MSTTKKLVSDKFHVESAKHFVLSVNYNDAAYYAFAAKPTPYLPDDTTIEQPNNSVQCTTFNVYDDMIFGKKITPADVNHMIKKNDWTYGTVYDMYDHTDGDLAIKDFYVFVQEGDTYNVYKCLSNGRSSLYPSGRASTTSPSGRDINPIESPADGYLWKYMGTVSNSTYNKFRTTSYAPFTSNSSVITGATPGTVEVIRVDDAGLGYDNYFVSAFRLEDIRIGGLDTVYGIPESASSINDFYQGCVIKMTSGAAAGEYREIVNYAIENNQKKIYLATAFDNPPLATDTFQIYPLVYVFGNGTETANCIARAIIDSNAGNSVSRIEILNAGENIRSADALLIVKDVVGVTANAVLTPIISPPGGHGSDPLQELVSNRIGVSVKFTETESGHIPSTNDFRTIGILKDPLFNNVALEYDTANTVGNFVVGETVQQFRNITLTGTVSTSVDLATVTGTDTLFDMSVVPGDVVLLSDNATQNFLATVSTVTSNTSLNLNINVPFTSTGFSMSLIKTGMSGVITATETGSLYTSNTDIKTYDSNMVNIIGLSSYASAQLTALSVNGETINGNFITYVGMDKFTGSINSGTFEEDELVTQPSAIVVANALDTTNVYANALLGYQPQARLFSATDAGGSDFIYLTNSKHVFNTNQTISGNSSHAEFLLSYKYNGDVVKDSGQVFYLENIDPISRSDSTSETIKIILEF